jgi:hypothetical protein
MTQENFNKMVADFFEALRKKTMLIIIDTASKNEKAVFSLVSLVDGKMQRFSPMLTELGFKNYGNIGNNLRGKGVELPTDFYNNIQYQHCI